MMNNNLAPLLFDHSYHELIISQNTAPIDILAFHLEDGLSQSFRYTIEFTSSCKEIQPEQMLMKKATFVIHPSRHSSNIDTSAKRNQPQRKVFGVIQSFKRLSTSVDESRYEVVLGPRFALLANSHCSAVYLYKTVPQIVEEVLRERHDFKGYDFHFKLAYQYPVREFVMQYNETDLAFVNRLLAEVGIWSRIIAEERFNIDVIEFCDDQQYYQFGEQLPLRQPSGMSNRGEECVWNLTSAHQVVTGRTATRDYNHQQAKYLFFSAANLVEQDSTTYGEGYHFADPTADQGDRFARYPAGESSHFYARLHHERALNGKANIQGMANTASLNVGHVLTITDGPDGFQQRIVITEVAGKARRDASFELHFSAIPYDEKICFRPPLQPKPIIGGTIPARVSSYKEYDTYSDVDENGHYRVLFLFDRSERRQGHESSWLRRASIYAGDKYGIHFPLIYGTEVAIAFEEGNPDRPYIAHALHDSEHPELIQREDYRRNLIRTAANNELQMEDDRGREHIKLSTEHGKSQLNLGFLVDTINQPPLDAPKRGAGFELRTNEHGTIRADKGLFISADENSQVEGEHLEMESALRLIKGSIKQIEEWITITKAHHNQPPNVEELQHYLTNAEHLAGAALLMSAPQGIGMVTPETALLQGAKALYLQSQGEVNIASGQRISANSNQAISLLAQQEGMRLISGKGALNIESHADLLSLTALKDITVQSTQGHLQLTAKNGITIGCGGAYIRLTPQGEIQIHSPTKLDFKGQHSWASPASEDFPLPELPQSVCEECLKRAEQNALGFVMRQ